jgi:cytochrome c oxidase assembly protein subunit 15
MPLARGYPDASDPEDRMRGLARFAWLTVAFNVATVLYGAVVRATGSGAGCGSHWPSCNGGALPLAGTAEEAIEFAHRATSGVALVLVAILVVWVFRARPRGDRTRKAAVASGILIVNEALLGAMLVLFEWVAEDQSNGRAISITLHLVNTLLLLGALALTAWWLSGGRAPVRPSDPGTRRDLIVTAAFLVLVGASGAITALGDTLFPAESLLEGIRDDFTGTFLVRLRWIHPIVAVIAAGLVLRLVQVHRPRSAAGTLLARWLTILVVTQLVAGVVNVVLLAPVWMQLLHLLLADAVWILLVLFGSESLADPIGAPTEELVAG